MAAGSRGSHASFQFSSLDLLTAGLTAPSSLAERLQLGDPHEARRRRARAALQSVALNGSASCSPWYAGPPVHWLERTTIRTCVAWTGENVKSRSSSDGATGRGASAGNALLALAYARW